ncbi:MAG TPA: AbgT family transporter [Candidatus Polarisedimenticolaceae bacterium]|nr:AbgT family transporter [Candidatus Polarisedimenticolaceae bacterium]
MSPKRPAPAPRGGGRLIARTLGVIESVGNALPHPATLFAMLAAAVVLASGLFHRIGVSAVHPGTKELVEPVSLISVWGLHEMLTKMVTNFTEFAPLGTVLVSLLGIGIAERSGLIGTALRLLVLSAPRGLLTFVIVFAGILSNTASEVGYVLLVPLGAMIFLAVGRNPIAGLAAAFAGVSGGYSANLLLGTLDPLLAGLSEEAARIIDPAYTVNPACNWYFMFVSTFFIAAAGTWVTEKIIVPRLGDWKGDEQVEAIQTLGPREKRGLVRAAVVAALFVAFLLAGTVPDDGFLRDPRTGELLRSPFTGGIVAFIFIGAALTGVAYGWGARTLRNDSDVIDGMAKSMNTLSVYVVLCFFAAQFVAYFKWTNLGLIFAIHGADLLGKSGLGDIPLILAFVALSAIINLAMGSASAKWAIMAPVFIPMFMLLGYSPELVQATYRVGDSATNVISPLMSYFPLVVAFMKRYDPNAGIGTVVATMLPYSVTFFIVWTALLIVWFLLGIPVGPGAPLKIG